MLSLSGSRCEVLCFRRFMFIFCMPVVDWVLGRAFVYLCYRVWILSLQFGKLIT